MMILPNSKWMDTNKTIIEEYIKGSGNGIVNPSLIFDKYLFWEFVDKTPKLNTKKGGRRVDYKEKHFKRFTELKLPITSDQYRPLKNRKNSISKNHFFTLTTRTRLIVNHGNESILENSIALHPYYGFPIIPGSAIKGVTRHYCEEFGSVGDDLIKTIFGNPPDDNDAEEGCIIFLDAWPENIKDTGFFEIDGLTTHYSEYYQGDKLPTDNQQTVPVNFLAVKKEIPFEFTIAPSSKCQGNKADSLISQTKNLIIGALKNFGAGAKTGSNYGYFK